jgi:hypothetical protein
LRHEQPGSHHALRILLQQHSFSRRVAPRWRWKPQVLRKEHRTSPMGKSTSVRFFMKIWNKVENIIGNNFVIGQMSVGHLVWPVGVKMWASLRMQVEWGWEWERETLHKGPFSLSRVSLITQEQGSLIWPQQVKPSDLLTFDRL